MIACKEQKSSKLRPACTAIAAVMASFVMLVLLFKSVAVAEKKYSKENEKKIDTIEFIDNNPKENFDHFIGVDIHIILSCKNSVKIIYSQYCEQIKNFISPIKNIKFIFDEIEKPEFLNISVVNDDYLKKITGASGDICQLSSRNIFNVIVNESFIENNFNIENCFNYHLLLFLGFHVDRDFEYSFEFVDNVIEYYTGL